MPYLGRLLGQGQIHSKDILQALLRLDVIIRLRPLWLLLRPGVTLPLDGIHAVERPRLPTLVLHHLHELDRVLLDV